MKNRILNNWSLKLLSTAIAIVIWMAIVNYDNPFVTRTITGIPIEIVNESTLTNNDMVYTLNGTATASVRVRCPRKTAYALKASDFKAEADFNKMYTLTNQVPVTVTCSSSNVSSEEITLLTQSIEVELESVLSKKMDVVVNVTGTPDSGYRVGETSTSPSSVTVRAPQSFLDQISYVGVEVNVEGVSQTVFRSVELKFYNAGGNVLDDSDVQALSVSTRDIIAEVEILNVKTVSLDYSVTGQDDVAEGYLYSGIEIDPASLEISGRKTTLADISVLRIPDGELDVSGADSNIVKTFDARELLPDGVSLVDSDAYTITVTLKIEKLMNKEFTLTQDQIQVKGLEDDRILEMIKDELVVTVEGLTSDLAALSADELTASIDVTDLGLGLHTLDMEVEVPYGFRVIDTSRVRVRIADSERLTSSESETGNTAAEEEDADVSSEENTSDLTTDTSDPTADTSDTADN